MLVAVAIIVWRVVIVVCLCLPSPPACDVSAGLRHLRRPCLAPASAPFAVGAPPKPPPRRPASPSRFAGRRAHPVPPLPPCPARRPLLRAASLLARRAAWWMGISSPPLSHFLHVCVVGIRPARFWNRNSGADHVFAASHNYGACFHAMEDVAATDGIPAFLKRSIMLQTFGVDRPHACRDMEHILIPPISLVVTYDSLFSEIRRVNNCFRNFKSIVLIIVALYQMAINFSLQRSPSKLQCSFLSLS